MRITKIQIKGYKALQKVSLPMRGLNVLIGPNGSGKTSFLEVYRLLASLGNQSLEEHINEAGGLSSILTRGKANGLVLLIRAKIADYPEIEYEVTIKSEKFGYRVAEEKITNLKAASAGKAILFHRKNDQLEVRPIDQIGFKRPCEFNVTESGLEFVGEIVGILRDFRKQLDGIKIFQPPAMDLNSPIRLPQKITPGFQPGKQGERLLAALYNMRSEIPDSYDRIEDVLKVAFPDYKRLEFPVVAAGRVALAWYDKFWDQPFDQAELSEGTLRFLWLVTTLLAPDRPPIILLDEPEVNLHPQLLMILADVLKEAACESQIIVATHSDRLIRWLKPEDVVVVDKVDGYTMMKRLQQSRLENWLEDYSLDELWEMGEIGGRL